MRNYSYRVSAIEPSATLATKDIADKLKKSGKPVISFATGEPDMPTPAYIKKAAVEALESNMTGYTSVRGTVELRNSICRYMADFCNLEYTPADIVVSSGAKHIIFAALQAIVDPEDEVVLPSPFWVTYKEQIRMAGGVPVVLETDEKTNFKFKASDLEKLISPRTKAVILTSPSNPTGMVYSRQELEEIAAVVIKHDLFFISDEIYHYLTYGKEFVSIASIDGMKERSVVVNGVSKTFSMTGWRIGWAACNPTLALAMSNYISHSTGNACSISQHAASVALDNAGNEIAEMKSIFEQRRAFFKSRVSSMHEVSCLDPDGAFYFFMDIRKVIGKSFHGKTISGSEDFCKLFLENFYVALVPGTAFGMEGYVRWTYSASRENISEGLDRLESFLSQL